MVQEESLRVLKEYCEEFFEYKEGHLHYKNTRSNRVKGTRVGWVCGEDGPYANYYITRILGKIYPLHRIIFLIHYNYLPELIDHKDRNKLNNSIENLREATRQQNTLNRGLRADNKSGFKGVSWDKHRKKWRAQLHLGKKNYYLGLHETPEDASEAYKEKYDELTRDEKIKP